MGPPVVSGPHRRGRFEVDQGPARVSTSPGDSDLDWAQGHIVRGARQGKHDIRGGKANQENGPGGEVGLFHLSR